MENQEQTPREKRKEILWQLSVVTRMLMDVIAGLKDQISAMDRVEATIDAEYQDVPMPADTTPPIRAIGPPVANNSIPRPAMAQQSAPVTQMPPPPVPQQPLTATAPLSDTATVPQLTPVVLPDGKPGYLLPNGKVILLGELERAEPNGHVPEPEPSTFGPKYEPVDDDDDIVEESHPIADGVRALTADQKKAIVDLFNTGMKASEIGPELGIKVPVVSAVLLPIRSKKKELTEAGKKEQVQAKDAPAVAEPQQKMTKDQILESAMSELSKEDLLRALSEKAKREAKESQRR